MFPSVAGGVAKATDSATAGKTASAMSRCARRFQCLSTGNESRAIWWASQSLSSTVCRSTTRKPAPRAPCRIDGSNEIRDQLLDRDEGVPSLGSPDVEMIALAREISPSIRTVLMTGYATDDDRFAVSDAPRLAKPFGISELEQALKQSC